METGRALERTKGGGWRARGGGARALTGEVVWVGADEMNRRKGTTTSTVFADLANKRVLYGDRGQRRQRVGAFSPTI